MRCPLLLCVGLAGAFVAPRAPLRCWHATVARNGRELDDLIDDAPRVGRADADAAAVRAVLDDVVAAVVARADSKEEAPLVARVSSESLADLEKKAPCLERSVSEAGAP